MTPSGILVLNYLRIKMKKLNFSNFERIDSDASLILQNYVS